MHAQDETPAETPPATRVPPPIIPEMQKPVTVSHSYVLTDGTPISLRLVQGIKVKEAHPGDTAELVLDHDLWVNDLLVARAGTPAQAMVVNASKAKWVSQGSKLAINISALPLLDGQTLPLRGVLRYDGGVGPAAQVGGYFVEQSLSCPICEIAVVPAALGMLIAPGTNQNIKAETIATVWVDGSVNLNLDALWRRQPSDSRGKVSIVRGMYGAFADRSLYCNGIPLAHLRYGRKLELDLNPGYYRFAINPKKAVFETYVGPASHIDLITDHDHIYAINEPGKTGKLAGLPKSIAPSRSENTESFNPFSKTKTEAEYLRTAKPVEAGDRYPTECSALEIVATAGEK